MRRLALAAVSAVSLAGCALFAPKPAWELPPPPPPEAPVVQPGLLHRAELENGLEVLVLEDHRLPRVVLGVTFRRGEGALPPESAGLASFTAELLERGAGERDALAFAEAVDSLGASAGAGAGWDTFAVSASGLSRDLDFLIGVLADMLLRPRFDPAEAERAKGERLAALEQAKDDPATLAAWYAGRAVYPGHRYGVPLSGSPETVAALDVAAARAYHAEALVPNDAIFSAAGDVDAQDLIGRIRAALGGWPRGEIRDPGPPPPERAPAERRILVVDRKDLVQARIVVAHEGIARTDEDRIETGLMNSVIGGSGFSSRLMTTLRSEAGLTYGVYSDFSLRRHPGPFQVSTFTEVASVRQALDIVLAELERGRAQPPGEDELTWARTLAVGRFSMDLETSASVLAGLVDLDVFGLPRDSLDTYRPRVRAVTASQVAKAARDHLHPERAAIVLVGPADAIVPQVESLGPVEVVTP
jgi:predicted Zn-dependent peptidase